MKFFFFLISFYIIAEVLILIFFPRVLFKNEFQFNNILIKDKVLGWRHKKNKVFYYFHRYINFGKKIKLKTNNYGILDNTDYSNKKKK